jgi:hypothetical protein
VTIAAAPRVDPPSSANRTKLVTLGKDIIDAWYTGNGLNAGASTTDEYYDQKQRTWYWNDAETAQNVNEPFAKLGLAALCAALYRFYTPRSRTRRMWYRRIAIETVDQWFKDHQDPVTGGMFNADVANVATDESQATFFGFPNLAIVIACLGDVDTRWSTQIGDALDYTLVRGEDGFYTNGNYMIYKLVAYQLGVRTNPADSARQTTLDDVWEFTYTPNTAQPDPNKWRGIGYREEVAATTAFGIEARGYFTETNSNNSGFDGTALELMDHIYTLTQAGLAATGYLVSGDTRFAVAMNATLNKFLSTGRLSRFTNQFDFSGGSRNAGPGVRNNSSAATGVARWMMGREEIEPYIEPLINNTSNSIDADFRRYLTTSHSTFVRLFGLDLASLIVAAHCAVLD